MTHKKFLVTLTKRSRRVKGGLALRSQFVVSRGPDRGDMSAEEVATELRQYLAPGCSVVTLEVHDEVTERRKLSPAMEAALDAVAAMPPVSND